MTGLTRRTRPSPAGVIATVAVGTGGAYAADKIGDIAKNAVRSKHIKDGQVTGRDAKQSTFKRLIQGRGKLRAGKATANQGGFLPNPIPLVKVPTMGQVELIYCGDSGQGNQIRVRLLSNDGAAPFFGSNFVSSSGLPVGTTKGEHVDHGGGVFADGGGEPYIAQAGTGGIGVGVAAKWGFTMWRSSGTPRVAHVTVSGLNGLISGDKCEVSAQGEIYD